MLGLCICLQQAEVSDDSDTEDPDEVFGFISIINLTDRKVEPVLVFEIFSRLNNIQLPSLSCALIINVCMC